MAEEVIVSIEAKDKTKAGVDKAKRNIGGIRSGAANALGAITGPAGLAAGAIAAVGLGAFKAISDFAAAADELSKTSQRTGVGAEELSKLQHAFDQSDLTGNDLEKTLTRINERVLAQSTRTNAAVEALAAMGKSIEDIENLSPDEAFAEIADGIAALDDHKDKVAAASDIFGKKLGPELLTLLSSGKEGLDDLGQEAVDLGIVISQETADIGAEFGDTVDEIGKTFQGAFQGILTAVLPIVTKLLQAFLSLLQGGGQVGEGLKRVWDFIVDVVEFAVNLYIAYIKDLVFNFVSLIQNGINTFLSIIESGLNLGKGLFVGFVNGVIGFIEGLVNGVIDLLVGFLEPHNVGLNWHVINPIIEGLNASRADFGRLSIEETVLGRVDFLSGLETIGITGGHIESVFQGGLPVLDLSNLAAPETNININVEGSVLSENDLAEVVNRGRLLGTIH